MKAYNKQLLIEYYVDFDTPNISFLKMAALLDAAGISNNLFFLRLDNKKLRGIDPFDPRLSDDLRVQVFQECVNNRWYFYREIFRVTEAGKSIDPGGGVAFELNRGNLAYLWATELNISCYLIMPRQTGKTWAAIADATWTHQFIQGSSILHFNKNQKDANDNLRRIQEAIRMLPLYMQHSNDENLESSEKRLVKNNEKNIRNTINASIEAMASAGNESKADAMARGRTASKIWYDELAFIFFNSTIYGAATPAFSKAQEVAIANDIPYGISITTTPGDLATPHGEFAHHMMEESITFSEKMYDYKRKKLYDIVNNTPGKSNFIFIQFNYLQLGKTDDWFVHVTKSLTNPFQIRREYLLEWMDSNGNSPFDPDDLNIIHDMSDKKLNGCTTYKINKYFDLNVYSEYHGRKPVLIGVDVATGRGRDQHAITVVNPETLLPMAFFHSNMISSTILKKIIVTIITKIYPNAILSVENNSVGTPLIDELKETPVGRCLYRERKKRTIDQVGANSVGKKRNINVTEYCHNVNSISRPQMMEMLETIVHYNHSHMAFPELFNEIQHMQLKNGRIDHSEATHDDITMSYLGILWVVRYGNGLKGRGIYYNIRETGEDEEEYHYDTAGLQRTADRLIFHKHANDDTEQANEELENFMLRDHSVQTSSDWAERERAEYYKELDKIDGINLDDDFEQAVDGISDSTKQLCLKNYYAMMHNDDEDPIQNLLDPSIDFNSSNTSLLDIYKW